MARTKLTQEQITKRQKTLDLTAEVLKNKSALLKQKDAVNLAVTKLRKHKEQ
jgi:hypothetical protein